MNEYAKKEKFDAADHSSLYTDFAVQMNEIEHMVGILLLSGFIVTILINFIHVIMQGL